MSEVRALNHLRAAAAEALHEQAWVNKTSGIRGLPTRLDGEAGWTHHMDVTAASEAIETAAALRWDDEELRISSPYAITRLLLLRRPRSITDREWFSVIGSVDVDDLQIIRTPDPAVPVRVWEVDGPDGTVVYLGCDLTLADEIYNGLPPKSRLFPVRLPAVAGA
jgi:hypothetical protein